MKTKYISGLLVLFLVTFFSCKKELEPQDSSVVIPSTSDNSSATPVSPGLSNSSQSTALPQQNSNSNAVGMNPPHGQAGHRCDIAVGAPLNSPSNKNVPVPVTPNSNLDPQVPAVLKMDSTATSPK